MAECPLGLLEFLPSQPEKRQGQQNKNSHHHIEYCQVPVGSLADGAFRLIVHGCNRMGKFFND